MNAKREGGKRELFNVKPTKFKKKRKKMVQQKWKFIFFPCQSLRLIFETVFLFNSRSSKFCSWTCADEMNTFLLRIYFVCKKIISPSTFILEDPGRTKRSGAKNNLKGSPWSELSMKIPRYIWFHPHPGCFLVGQVEKVFFRAQTPKCSTRWAPSRSL